MPPVKSNDISTVVSILPVPIHEVKPGLIPGVFKMEPAKKGDFELLVVERCFHPVYLDENRPRLHVPDPSELVASSIVNDYKFAVQEYAEDVAEPGLSYVFGEFTNDEKGKSVFKAQHAALLKRLNNLQDAWFLKLVQKADDRWSTYRQHRLITDLDRIAAMRLELTDREWLVKQKVEEALSKCRFCFTQVHPDAIICPSCHGDLRKETYQNVTTSGTVTK